MKINDQDDSQPTITKKKQRKAKTNAVAKPMFLSDYSYWHRYCKIIENRLNLKKCHCAVFSCTNFSARKCREKNLFNVNQAMEQPTGCAENGEKTQKSILKLEFVTIFHFVGIKCAKHRSSLCHMSVCVCVGINCTFAFYKRNKSSKV